MIITYDSGRLFWFKLLSQINFIAVIDSELNSSVIIHTMKHLQRNDKT